MKLLLYDMGAYTQNDIMDTLVKLQIPFRNIVYKLDSIEEDTYFQKRVKELMDREAYDAVLSVNYFPVLAELCHQRGICYLSWCYDSPINLGQDERTVGYDSNYIFLFDRAECQKYRRKGYQNIYHLPLAVNTERLDKIQIKSAEWEKYGADISMVGQLYKTELPELLQPLDEYIKGYLAAVTEVQMKLYGGYILPETITDSFVHKINDNYRKYGQQGDLLKREGLITAVAKHITHMERILLLELLSEEYRVKLFGPDAPKEVTNVEWRGSAGYFDEMPKIFKTSSINLNASIKCITSGIPLRALDIMGSGGFLLSNYQTELAENFIDGEEVAMYSSIPEAIEKCNYYLSHKSERKQISEAGYHKVKELYRYEDRIRTMLRTAGLPN